VTLTDMFKLQIEHLVHFPSKKIKKKIKESQEK